MNDIMDAALKGLTRTKMSWDHRLQLKHIWADFDEAVTMDETKRAAIEAITAVTALRDKVTGQLQADLDEVIDLFDAVAATTSDGHAKAAFNAALHTLYDHGDYMKRIWVD